MLKNLYALGVFDPANAPAAEILLDAMDFPGIESVRAQVGALIRTGTAKEKGESTKKNSLSAESESVPLEERGAVRAAQKQDEAMKATAV